MTLNRRVLKRVHSPLKSPKRNNTSLRKKALIKQLSGDVQFGAASKANVKVLVRIRPHNTRELENGDRSILKTVDEHMMIFDPKEDTDDFFFKGVRQHARDLNKRPHKEQKFIFERIYDVNSTNEQIFEETTKDLVDTILSGYNCSVFAYGATGAGKTFTMLGKPELPGITFLTLMELYHRIDELKEEKTCEVGVSYLEVYNETVRDLLQPGKLLNVQENGSQVLVPGLSLHKPENAEELLKMLAFGNQNRTQHPTDANAESSRSHAVFQIFVRQQARTANLKSNVCIAKLSMIDLAGSERGAATGFKGARFREGANINKSLLALGNCINALADGLRHVPYRDSKLTRLLKDSLGGNCRSVMIANVSPAVTSFEDTFNTLRYANRAKTIKTTLKKNLMNVDQHVTQYVKIVEDLREEICSLKEKVKMYEEKEAEWESSKATLQLANDALENQEEVNNKILKLEQLILGNGTTVAKAQSIHVSEEENAVQRKLEETGIERKALRRELLQLESSQRELELKIHNCNLRLERMRVVSFISQKLDKSISKCERTIRNLSNKLDQTKRLQQNVELKLEANLSKLHKIQVELYQWGFNASQPSLASKALMEKNETALAERDLLQLTEYLRGLVKDSIYEQNFSEQFICQLLTVVRGFYVQLRANHVCTPEMEKLFENCIDSMDESKILWADQQNIDEPFYLKTASNTLHPTLDINRLTLLPVITGTFISPAIPQDNKVFRRSILKSSSIDDHQNVCVKTVSHSGKEMDSFRNGLPDISEDIINRSNEFQESKSPDSHVLSAFSIKEEFNTPNPSPVIGSSYLSNRIFVPMSSSQVSNGCFISQVSSDRINCQVSKGNCNIDPLSPSASVWKEPVARTLNVTMDFPSGSHVLNTTVDIPCKSSMSECSLSKTKAFKLEEVRNSSYIFNTTVDRPLHFKAISTTNDLTIPKVSKIVEEKGSTTTLNTTMDMPTHFKALNTTVDITNLEAFKMEEKSSRTILNTTMDMPSHFKMLNTTVDLTNTKALKIEEERPADLNTTGDRPSHFKALDTTVDLLVPVYDIDFETSPGHSNTSTLASKGSVIHTKPLEKEISASRKLFQRTDFDSTFSLSMMTSVECSPPGISPLEKLSPGVSTKPVVFGKLIQRPPLTPVENKTVLPKEVKLTLNVPSVKVDEIPMPPPSTTKKGILKRYGITPHKTPGTSGMPAGQTRLLSTKKASVGLRRSLSTSSLMPIQSSSYQVSPILNRKYNGIGGAIRRTSSFLKPNKLMGKNQENIPPEAQKAFTQSYISLPHRDTISSAAKHVSLHKT